MNEVTIFPRMRRVMALVSKSRAETILDIGCGDGSYSILLKEILRANEVSGVEIVPEVAAQAKEKGIEVAVLDVESINLPFEEDYFDAISALEIIEHLFSPDHLLEEIHRVLKPNGFCVISTPNLASWHCRLHLLMGYQPYPLPVRTKYAEVGRFLRSRRVDHYYRSYLDSSARGGREHVQFFTLRGLKELLESHGFTIKKTTGSPDVPRFHIPLPLSWLVSLAEGITSKFLPGLASSVIVAVTKK